MMNPAALSLSDHLDHIATGDLFFVRGTGYLDRLIEWWTGSAYSHVAFALRLPVGPSPQLYVFEACIGLGVRLTPITSWLKAYGAQPVDWYCLAAAAEQRQQVADYCLGKWGEDYAGPWQFLLSFTRLGRLVRRLLGLPTEVDPNRPFCSWIATEGLEKIGLGPTDGEAPALASPGDVARYSCLKLRGEIVP